MNIMHDPLYLTGFAFMLAGIFLILTGQRRPGIRSGKGWGSTLVGIGAAFVAFAAFTFSEPQPIFGMFMVFMMALNFFYANQEFRMKN